MITAGRIKHHIYHNITDSKNTVLIVGYCAPQTIGGKLRQGKETIKMFGETLAVNATIEMMDSFSAHADRIEMAAFLANQKNLKGLHLVHGEIERQESFKAYLEEKGFKNINIPKLDSVVKMRD